MKKYLVIFCALATLVGVASAQANSQTNASASSNTSVSAGQNGASVSSNTNVNANSQTSVAEPKHEQRPDKDAKRGESKKDEPKGGSMDTSSALAAGTTVNAVLAKPIDSRKCKQGDEVVATASQDVKADGKVVIKKGSKLIGHVTEASAKGEGHANSSLGIMFDHAVAKDGHQVQMNSVVQAIAAAQTSAAASSMGDDMSAMGSGSVASSGGARSGGGGLLGGVSSTASSATGAATNLGGNATGAVGSTVNSTANVGHGVGGALSSNSNGVVGLNGLSLATNAANSTQGSVITGTGKSVHLDSGTQLMLQVVKQ